MWIKDDKKYNCWRILKKSYNSQHKRIIFLLSLLLHPIIILIIVNNMLQWLSDKIPNSLQNRIGLGVQLFMFLISVMVMGAIVVDYGFVLDAREMSVIYRIYDYGWWIYLLLYISQLIFQWRTITQKTVFMTVVIGLLLLVSVLSKYFSSSLPEWMNIFGSKYYTVALLGMFALLEVSKGVVAFINKKTNPALLMAACFAVIIALGEKLNWDIFITKIGSIFIVAMVQFILNKLVSFKTKKYKE